MGHEVETVALEAFGHQDNEAHFLMVAEAAAPAPPRPFSLLRERGWHRDILPSAPPIGPLGVRRLRRISLTGSGYLFADGKFILEPAHTSRVALSWLRDETFPDNPLTTPPQRERTIDRETLIVFGPGFPIWGHFLLDYLPRIVLAQTAFGQRFGDLVIPIPDDSPAWLYQALEFFCGVGREQLLPYDRHRDRLVIEQAWLPSFAHGGEHVLHPYATTLFRSFVPPDPSPAPRRICLSRRRFERETRSMWRVFEGRERFEAAAVQRGYELVCPEDLALPEQIALFAGATHLVGEFGSGLHNAAFSAPGTRVGCFPMNNALQNHIADAGRHELSIVARNVTSTDERGVVFFRIDPDDIERLFDRMDET